MYKCIHVHVEHSVLMVTPILFLCSIDMGGMWLRTPSTGEVGPSLFKGSFTINDVPKDTFIDMEVQMWYASRVLSGGRPGYVPPPQIIMVITQVLPYF